MCQGHCNFYVMPLMLGLEALRPVVNQTTMNLWESLLREIQPFEAYHGYQSNNWGIVALTGEYLREQAGLSSNGSWWRSELDKQISEGSFTPDGMYEDHTGTGGLNPMPYDVFPRKYYSVMIARGYNESHAAYLSELSRRGAWMSLLMQSPLGEVPTGGRSSQHQWNEAVSVALYEMWATRLQDGSGSPDGKPHPELACMFKRGS